MKIFYFWLLICVTQVSYSQCDDSTIYSEAEKESFVRIYVLNKKEKSQSKNPLFYSLASKHSITPKQFQEIQHTNESKRSLSENEQAFVSELQDLKLKDKAKLKITEENNCQELKLEHITYLAMHQQYRSCIKFQRSLSDYFTKWMK